MLPTCSGPAEPMATCTAASKSCSMPTSSPAIFCSRQTAASQQVVDAVIQERPGTSSAPTSSCSRSAKGAWAWCSWPSRPQPIQRPVALEDHQAGHGHAASDRPLRGRAAGPGDDGPSEHRQGARRRSTTDTGRPYFVMELVKGVPITEVLRREAPHARASGWNCSSPVCQAVQHAHQKGIIHRDIKPTNVLVADVRRPARSEGHRLRRGQGHGQQLTEHTMFTEFGQVIGTIEYMSPEQAKFNQLDIDTRSDIYSLGVLLYELLDRLDALRAKAAARGGVRRSAADHPRRRAAQAQHASLSTTRRGCRTIAANRHTEPARLEQRRARRAGLDRDEVPGKRPQPPLRDGQRPWRPTSSATCNDEPVQACPPSALYRFRKFARRNKVALIGFGMLAAMLLVISVRSRQCWLDRPRPSDAANAA